MIWSGPLQIVLAIILLYREIGPAVFAGVGVMVFFVLFNVFLGRILKKIQVTLMSIKVTAATSCSHAFLLSYSVAG